MLQTAPKQVIFKLRILEKHKRENHSKVTYFNPFRTDVHQKHIKNEKELKTTRLSGKEVIESLRIERLP